MDERDEGSRWEAGEAGEPLLAIGLMSGTSMDGIDAALIETDGVDQVTPLAFVSIPYEEPTRERLREAMRVATQLPSRLREGLGEGRRPPSAQHRQEKASPPPAPPASGRGVIDDAEAEITRLHADAVRALLVAADVPASAISVVGFHGQTIAHRPDLGWTWQIGDGAALAAELGMTVVSDFRSADVEAGGQGAPLLPVYHRALTAGLERPLAVLNLGGIANVTAIGRDGELIAFDTGPANALVDDWVRQEAGLRFDDGGALAASGEVHDDVLDTLLDNHFFDLAPPKSLDRGDFTIAPARGLSAADGAATLTAFSARAVALGLNMIVDRPVRLLVAGGGRHNATLMRMVGEACGLPAEPIETVGWNGDATEAEGFAYMAVRTLRGLPISFPGTTGVAHPLEGGRIDRP